MENKYQEEERYYEAKKRVEEIKGFYGNLIAYVVVNIGLMVINLLTSPAYLWFFWPMLGWGIGVVFHGMKVFNYLPFLGKDWEEQKIKEFMEKEDKKQTWK
ncbi:2TM domain-containing protein [Flavobacterium franklandianum]|uniref:2TM domain-containing protein n=1 Tax=Flavobacterium franklandianum TaxID=2594430 RepID=A0A553C7F8_9FLAO|nr:2TM domain-containing protein [Flavobacterium franklandianum]TRX16457.1 2TM domain-containing protein [Flavobacterium franklandianum]